ncbi:MULTISPECIES: hydroxyacylglutathione hydrolase [unclassified Moraxella]|uniref:hydroxyacylglutathione hydrolase n=1 Tax=unclassified Moraxella TaxID=2685852 RepID=UPI003AF5037A
MLKIHPIPAFNDNYIWAIINEQNQEVIIVDAGDAKPVLDFVHQNSLSIRQIWVTHHHNDHIGGVAELAQNFPNAQVFAHADVLPQIGLKNPNQGVTVGEGSELKAWGDTLNLPLQVWQTAGHTDNHLAFLLTFDKRLHIFCGDTLFRGGCGRVFTGTIEQLFESFDRFNELHDDKTLFYPAHEYTLSNLKFAQSIQPNNADIAHAIEMDSKKRDNNQPTLPTTLADERLINPFMQIIYQPHCDELIASVNQQLPNTGDEPLAVFSALRELKNRF